MAGVPYVAGLPIDLVALIFLAVVVMVIAVSRSLGRNIGIIRVSVIWVHKNYSALKFPAKEDLRGIFLEILKGRKTIEEIQKKGQPVELKDVKIDKEAGKVYLVEREGKEVPYYLLKAGARHERLFVTVEGSGRTIDFIERAEKIRSGEDETESTALIHEEKEAAKSFFQIIMAAASGSFRAVILPMVAGAGLGVSALFLVELFFGILK